jgi:hypothetical protein
VSKNAAKRLASNQLGKDLSVRIAILTSKQKLDTSKENARRGENFKIAGPLGYLPNYLLQGYMQPALVQPFV